MSKNETTYLETLTRLLNNSDDSVSKQSVIELHNAIANDELQYRPFKQLYTMLLSHATRVAQWLDLTEELVVAKIENEKLTNEEFKIIIMSLLLELEKD